MVITLDEALAAALADAAKRQGLAPQDLAIKTLQDRFLTAAFIQPRDEWERRLLAAASDCGVSLSNEALSSEGLYD